MGSSDVILFGDRCVRPSYCSQRQPRFQQKRAWHHHFQARSV